MKFLLDSDFLVALYKPDDASHARSSEMLGDYYDKHDLIVLNTVIQESTTVISKRMGMIHARKFYVAVRKLVGIVLSLNDEFETRAWEIFLKQTKKGCSFVDCANLVAIETHKFDGILSFDKFYPERIRVWRSQIRLRLIK